MVKRYRETVYGCEENSWTEMQESEHGMWVYYSDYAALAERCERLEAALRDVLGWIPNGGAWHTDAPMKSIQNARDLLSVSDAEKP